MVSSTIIGEIQQATKQPTLAGLPDRLSSFIQSSCECNPKLTKNGFSDSTSCTNATAATVMTTSANVDTYLFGGSLFFIRDATATSTSFTLRYTNELGAVVNLLSLPGITLTAGSGGTQCSLSHPIKVKRSTNIEITSSSNTGNFKLTGQVYFFLDEHANDG